MQMTPEDDLLTACNIRRRIKSLGEKVTDLNRYQIDDDLEMPISDYRKFDKELDEILAETKRLSINVYQFTESEWDENGNLKQ